MSGDSDVGNLVMGIFMAFVAIVLELAMEPFIESQLSEVPSPFGAEILLIRAIEVILVLVSFFGPQMTD